MNDSHANVAAPASFGLRLIAMIYDVLPLLALWFAAATLVVAIMQDSADVRHPASKLLVQLLGSVFTALYFIVSWVRGGQTVGMRPWRLRVVGAGGGAIGLRSAAVRFAVACVSLTVFGLGFLWCLVDAQRRSWHDIVAGTLLVRLELSADRRLDKPSRRQA